METKKTIPISLETRRLAKTQRGVGKTRNAKTSTRTRTLRFRQKKTSRKVNLEHIQILAQPVIRKTLDARDPFAVSPSALTYHASDRIQQLAAHRQKPSIPPRIPGKVSRAALKAVAGPNIIKLAVAPIRSPGREIDLRENAFTVSRTALIHKCSARIKFLAQPKKYGKTKRKNKGNKKSK